MTGVERIDDEVLAGDGELQIRQPARVGGGRRTRILRVRLGRTARAQDGQALVLSVFALTLIVALLAYVIDLGFIERAHHQVQLAADSGALAAADQLATGSGSPTQVGTTLATTNAPNSSVTVTTPYGGDSSEVQVKVTQTVPDFFSKFFGASSTNVTATAVAKNNVNSGTVGDANISPDGCPNGDSVCTYYAPNVLGYGPWQVMVSPAFPDPPYPQGNVDLQNCDGGTGQGCSLPSGYSSPWVIDLNGYNPSGVEQTIATTAGTYKLTFLLTGNPYQGDDGYTFTGVAQFGSDQCPFQHQNQYPDVTYELWTCTFYNIPAGQTTLEFYSTSNRPGLQNYAGPEIADISLQYPSTALVQ